MSNQDKQVPKPANAAGDADVAELFARDCLIGKYAWLSGRGGGWLKSVTDGQDFEWQKTSDIIILEEARRWAIEQHERAAYWKRVTFSEMHEKGAADRRRAAQKYAAYSSTETFWAKHLSATRVNAVVRLSRGIAGVLRDDVTSFKS